MGRFGGVTRRQGSAALLRLLMLATVLGLAPAVLAPAASAVVVIGAHGQRLGVAPHRGLAASLIPGAARASAGTRAGANGPQVSDNMTYHDGPVLHSSTPYLVFWDPSGSAMPADWKSLLSRYFSDLAATGDSASDVYGVDRQYSDATGFAGASQSFSAASQALDDADPYPARDAAICPSASCLTDAQVQQELVRLLGVHPSLPTDGRVGANALPAHAPVYYVVLPPGVDECFTGNNGAPQCASSSICSYHSALEENGEDVVYAVIPSLALTPATAKDCQIDGNPQVVQEPNGSLADVMLKYLTHEATDTSADPLLNAWYAPDSNEVADNCNEYGAQPDPPEGISPNAFQPTLGGNAGDGTLYNQLINGDQYYLQSAWSNGDGNCDLAPGGGPGAITASFSAPAGPDVIGTPLTFDPTGSSTSNTYSSVTWDWGDGTPTTFTKGPGGPSKTSHTYAKSGSYTVTLTLVDDLGDLSTATQQINVYAPPTASFTFTPSQPFAGDPVQFDASGSSDPDPGVSITGYQWDYGDGQAASGATPTPHAYASPGTYTLTLTVTNSVGVTSQTRRQVTVVAEPPAVSFTIDPTAAAVNQAVSFNATATDPHASITGYQWDWGDGTPPALDTTSATTDAPTHPYGASGTYTVTLTVSADNGTTTSVTHQLTVGPVAAFTYTPPTPQNGTPVSFQSTSTDPEASSPSIVGYTWDFGDGTGGAGANPNHTYARPGTYEVTLTVTNSDHEADAMTQAITVADAPPIAAFTVTTPVPAPAQPVSFDASASSPSDPTASISFSAWSFGDGTAGTGARPTHTYAAPGTYTVHLTVTDSYGASSTIVHQVVVHAPPLAAFTSAPAGQLENAPVAFNATASNDSEPGVRVTSYAWRFGDGATGTGATPTHTYAAPGTDTVTLTVTNSLGLTSAVTSSVAVLAPPSASFAVRTARPATGQPVDFASTSSTDPRAAIASYRWTFGDGAAPATGPWTSHAYRNPGSYAVTLTIVDSFGHAASTIMRVSVARAGRITKATLAARASKLALALNDPGVLSVAGKRIRVKKAGTITIPIHLTAAQRRTLATAHKLTLRLRVRFTPAAGPPQTELVIITFRSSRIATARLTRA